MKKVLSYLLVLMLLIQIVPFSGYAAASADLPVEQPSIYIDTDTYCRSGKTLTVDVCINNNPGFISTDFTVDFDSALTLVGATNGEAFASITDAQTGAEIEGLTYVPPAALNANGQIDSACHFLWYANTIDDRNIKNGTIVTLVFKIEDDVNAYDKLDISVQSLSSNNIDKTRATYDLVANTVITVLDYMPGDVNNDCRLNVFDIVFLAQYISDGCKTIPESYNATVNEKAADVTGDGRINVFDLVFLSQYIADGCQTRKDSYGVKLTFCDPKCEHTGMAAIGEQTATCTKDGNIAYWYCADCAKYFSNAEATTEIAYADTVIAASGHTEVVDQAVAPSCSETGLTEGSHCSVCNEVLVAQTEVGKANHTPGAQATCTEDQICTACGEVLESANGHIPGVEATCIEPQRCTVCQTVLDEATGHSLTYVEERDPVNANDPGNCAYWQCSVCNKCYLDANATQEIALTDTAWEIYLVYFFDLENDTYTVKAYKKSEVLSLKNVTPDHLKGYDFNGWHTSENFTEQNKISVIPAGNADNINLYANRSLHEYKITLLGLGRSESWSYNIVDGIKFTTPKWKESAGEGDCLIFSHWSDENGDKITEIRAGEIGDRTIEANWIYKENYAVSNPDKYTYVGGYQNQDGKYSFIYEIGAIKNLVLSKQHNYSFDGLTEHTESETKTYTVGAKTGRELAQTVSKIVSSSSEVSNIETNTTTHTDGWEVGAKWKPEIEYAGIKASAWEFSGGYSNSDTETYENTGFTSENNYEEDGTEDELRSTIDFYTEEETSRTVSDTFTPGVTPIGNYTWARLMDVKVYGIVTYNPYTGNYVFDIYSVPCNVHDGLLYTLPSELEYDVNIVSGDTLDFEIPFASIPNLFYTIEYDANGGEGEMPKSIHELGVTDLLLSNEFTKSGYQFAGWKIADEDSFVLYTDEQVVCDIASAGETVKLYAHWVKNDYTIQYNANKPTNAGSSVLNVPVDTTCKYDTEVTLGSEPSLYGWTFDGWYRDAACKVKVGDANEVVANANLTTLHGETVVLYAKWTADPYTVTYNANGGTGTTETSTHTYDNSSTLSPNGFTRSEYTFLGWSTDSTATTPTYANEQVIKNLATSGNVTLYAVWVKTSATIHFTPDNGTRDITFTEGKTRTESINTNMSISDLTKNGYTSVTISVSFDCKSEYNLIMFNYAALKVVARNADLYSGSWHLKNNMSGSWENKTVTLTVDLTKLNEDASFNLVWSQPSGTGNGEEWYLGTTVVTVTAKK